jgi:uracil-DNA glycosylase
MSVLLLGEAPSKGGDRYHHFPLSGPPVRVLCTLAGIPPQPDGSTYGRWTWALYDHFECRNLFERYRDATPWSAPAARARAVELRSGLTHDAVVLLGRRVTQAMGCTAEFYEWFDLACPARTSEARAVSIPHPSGLNRVLNDPAERARCGIALREALTVKPTEAPSCPA